MITCTRRLQFCAGHRVYGHENKCANVHGHNYVVWLTAEVKPIAWSTPLDSIGRVIDFSLLKDLFGKWIDLNWDHGFIYWRGDRELSSLFSGDERLISTKSFALQTNPTAENLALYLLEVIGPELLADTSVRLTRVVIEETENCLAEANL